MIISKEELNRLYWEQEKSMTEIAVEKGVSCTAVYRKMVKYGIERRTRSEAESGSKNPMYGKKHSDEAKHKIAEQRLGRCTLSEDEKAKKSEAWKGTGNPNYAEHEFGEEKIDSHGYVWIYVGKDYPRASYGWRYKHIYVMEKTIGRTLTQTEVVHHIDGIKTNNEPENLMLFSNNSAHMRYHNMLKSRAAGR